MRFGHTSTLSLLSVGVALALAHGCGGIKESTFNNSGATGSNTGSSGSGGTGSGTGSGSGSGSSLTGSGSSVTTIMPPPTTGSTGAGGSGNFGDASCGGVTQGTKQIPSDIFIMQDKSGSMECPAAGDACGMGSVANWLANNPTVMPHPTRWEATTMALNAFVASPAAGMAGIGVGIGFFAIPGNNSVMCNVMGYATPVVPIAPLPMNAMPITTAIGMMMPADGTPTTPALTGAIQYARTYTTAQMGQRTASVVFVTDGLPSGCGSTVENATMAALEGFTGTPSIKTYVIGLGAVGTLDAIALAGSGGMTHFIPATGDVSTALQTALTAITGMVTCNYMIPVGSDPRLVNLKITIGANGMPQDVGKVDNLAACGALGGWYYDVNPPAGMPTQIILCPQSCMPLQGTPNSGVQLQLGCPSLPPR